MSAEEGRETVPNVEGASSSVAEVSLSEAAWLREVVVVVVTLLTDLVVRSLLGLRFGLRV